ncbi:MAG: sulfite exporter TauE/SafE family protein [Elusimicrobiota bacterium]
MEPLGCALLTAVGVLAGFTNVMAGGGSLLTLPVMVFLGLSGPVANGTNRIAILLQNASAITSFRRQGLHDFRLSLSLALCALPGAAAGAYLGTKLEGVWFNRMLAAIMVAVLLLILNKKKTAANTAGARPQRIILGHFLMIGAGLYGGFIQAGVGFILMAVLHRIMGLDLVRVNMHKVFIVGIYTIAALAVFAWRGQVWLLPGLALAAGNAAGGWLGAQVSVKKGDRAILAVFSAAIVLLALKLLLT